MLIVNGDPILFRDERAIDYYGDGCEHEFLWIPIVDIRAEFDGFIAAILDSKEKL